MNRASLIKQIAFMAGVLAYIVVMFVLFLRRQRRRRELVEVGRVPSGRAGVPQEVRRRHVGGWILMAILMAWVGFGELYLRPRWGTWRTNVGVWGVLFVAAWFWAMSQVRGIRDPVVLEALRVQQSGDVAGAIGLLREHAGERDRQGRRGLLLGTILMEQGRNEEALAALRRASAEPEATAMVRASEAMVLHRLGRDDEAGAVLAAMREREPFEASAAAGAAFALAEMGRQVEAAEQLRQAEELASLYPDRQRCSPYGFLAACRKRIETASQRGFPVQIKGSEPQSG